MKYELAKELKDAGFQFKTTNFGANDHVKQAFFLDEPYGLGYIPPTLSELIEACGDRFRFLKKKTSQWTAQAHGIKHKVEERIKTTPNLKAVGETPEEAVARLWLALNHAPHQHPQN